MHVAPCCPADRALLQPARRALLQPARRALLPCASRPAAASTSRPTAASASRSAALRIAPCSPPSRPTATTAAAASRATAAASGGAARSTGSAVGAGGAGGAIGSAGCAASVGGATGSAGGIAGAGGAGPTTDRHCLSWPLSRQLQWLGVDSSGHCLSWTTPPLSNFASSELFPQRCVTGSVEAAALGASESAAALGGSEFAVALGVRASPATGAGAADPGGAGAAGAKGAGGAAGATGAGAAGAASPGGARTRGTGAARAGGAACSGGATGAAGSGGAGVAGAGGTGAGGTGVAGAARLGGARIRGDEAAEEGGAAGAGGARGATRAAGTGSAGGTAGAGGAGAGGSGGTGGARAASHGGACTRGAGAAGAGGTAGARGIGAAGARCAAGAGGVGAAGAGGAGATRASTPVRARHVARPRPPPVPGTHGMALCPSSVPQRVVLPEPPMSSLPHVFGPESDLAHAATFALVTKLVDFAARSRLDYVASLVTESESVCPPFVGGEPALSSDVLEDRQFELECLAAALPRFTSMLLCPEGDPDALDIPTPRSYTEAIAGEYSSQWQTAMDAEMASWKSTGTYIHDVPTPGANIVDGMWIFRVKRPPGSPPAFKARYVARGFIYGLRRAPREWQDTLRTALAALGFAPSSADPSLFLRTDTTLSPFYVLVYVDDLVFATADTEALALVKGGAAGETHLHGPGSFDASASSSSRHSPLLCLPATCYQLHLQTSPTLGMGLVLGGQGSVVLTGHSDASWTDDHASQGATLADLPADRIGGAASFSLVLYVDKKAMLALCREQRLEHRTKHIALRYFLARELQQRGQLRLSYMASRANTSDVFTKALGSGDLQHFCYALGLLPVLPHLLVSWSCTCCTLISMFIYA
ncbi:unnamed protein product [Closterium sp. NIES-53]